MPKITYINVDGARTTVCANSGDSVMLTAIKNNISGIDADCGGACACATCHLYVDDAWTNRLAPMGEMEKSMLDFASSTNMYSRLSCQIQVTDELDGLVVTLPESQR
jgi:2Fe-2S ferredoxin